MVSLCRVPSKWQRSHAHSSPWDECAIKGLAASSRKNEALVCDSEGAVVCRFARAGGLYVSRLKLKSHELFARQAR